MDITLIVKASNQQFDDQTIKCEPSWTIRRLKGHLTEVYPGKPTTDEQKLIYSGQLLGDSVVLKDILRTYDGQQAHTVHLVFTPKNNRHRDFSAFGNSGGSSSSNPSKTMSPKSGSESGVTTAASSSRSGGSDPAVRSPEPGTDGLRQRNVTGGQSQSTAAPAMNTASPISPASADYIMGQHLAMQNWMQQAYMQYLNQYMNVISNGQNPQSLYASAPTNLTNPTLPQPSPQPNAALATPANQNPILAQTLPNLAYYPYLSTMNSSPMPSASSIPAPITSSGTIPSSPASPPVASSVTAAGPSSQPSSSSPAPTASPVMPGTSPTANPASTATATAAAAAVEDTSAQAQPAPVAADAAAPAAAAAAAAAPARRFPNIVVEEQENRDWLDIFFSMCRVGILMTVVYLYSSPTRCLTVFIIGILLYLYQIGFFRNNNNTDRLERARQMVVQQMNNAHGIRPNGAGLRARAPLAPAAAEPAAAAANDAQQASAAAPQPTESTAAKATADADTTDGAKPEESSSSQDSPAEETPTTMTTVAATPAVEAHAEEQAVADPSEMVPEANRVNLNDVAAFLRTLVLSFFTSIIPDMPAA